VAEVDCIDDDDEDASVDVTMVESGEEITLSASSSSSSSQPSPQLLLVILESDGSDRLQERILLNLARCMHQLADLDRTKHRPKYLKAAVLACSLAMVVHEFHSSSSSDDDAGETNTNTKTTATTESALYLRSKAQGLLSKWSHAIADAKRLARLNESRGNALLNSLQRRKRQQAKNDKKLSKAVCQLVKNVTSTSPVSNKPTRNADQQHDCSSRRSSNRNSERGEGESAMSTTKQGQQRDGNNATDTQQLFLLFSHFLLLLPALVVLIGAIMQYYEMEALPK